jgi:uncharacterized membrane protein
MSRPGRAVEDVISRLLIVGVVASLALVVLGTVVSFVHHPDYLSSSRALSRLLHGGSAPHSIDAVLEGVRHWRGRAIVLAGLLLLILTPVARVVASLVGFIAARDRAYVVLTACVLALLALSVVLGRAGG